MAPTTRSQTARIAGFPDIPHEGQESDRKTRNIPLASAEKPPARKLTKSTASAIVDGADVPPTYTIDLSLPPAQRYVEVAAAFKDECLGLTVLFEETVKQFGLSVGIVTRLARLLLRRLHDSEQTEEIRGISNVTGIDMYLLVALNVLLDLFMGCTSGGVRIRGGPESNKMLHFRTLDWGMDPLRRVIVQLEFVERPGGEVIARSVTYVGFVGVLTGVRKDLSVSLNFRPYHDNDDSKMANLKFYGHHLLVLLGIKPSISSILRSTIIPNTKKRGCFSKKPPFSLPTLADVIERLPSIHTTAAYLIFCDGDRTAVFEKDRITAKLRTSTDIIVATNNDEAVEADRHVRSHAAVGMSDLIAESRDRSKCFVRRWERRCRQYLRNHPGATVKEVRISKDWVVESLEIYPITNEETHYATVMDPKKGEIVWIRRWLGSVAPKG